MIDPAFWKDKRVFLTGHTGFKGSWLSLWLGQFGAHVYGYSLNPPTKPALFDVLGIDRVVDTDIQGDVRVLDKLAATMQKMQPEIVIHMAAQALVRESYHDPVGTFATNVMGTVNVMEAVRQTGSVRVVLNVTTDKVYENDERGNAFNETDRLGGHDPYSNSKACSELVSASYADSYLREAGVGVATARSGNVLGGGDWAADRILPDALRAFMAGRKLRIRNPNAVRPWQHVMEPLSGYLLLAQRLFEDPAKFAGGWNFGPTESDVYSVAQIVERLVELWGGDAAWDVEQGDHPHEANYLQLDCKKSGEELGWQPAWELDRALAETVAWFKAWQDAQAMADVTREQIERYMADAARA